MNEIDEYRAKAGSEKFDHFKNTVYSVLKNMQPGDLFRIEEQVSVKNQPIFIKLACLYILESGWNCNIEITGMESNIIKGVKTPTVFFAELRENRIKCQKIKSRIS